MTRAEAYQIISEWVTNDNLLGHMLAVEAVMAHYAAMFGEDIELWRVAGLLHDADWEKYPNEHPQKIIEHLKTLGVDPKIVQAINAHGGKGAIEPQSQLDKTLFACDEISGFIVAVARMRPTKFEGMEPISVIKKLKDKRFAANVSRGDIQRGAELLEAALPDHITHVITAITPLAPIIGL